MAIFRFRLQYLLDQRLQAKEAAEKSMTECQRELQDEQENLASLQHETKNLAQKILLARRQMLVREPALVHNLMQRMKYLSGMAHDAEELREALFAQELVVEDAEAKLQQAHEHLVACSREADILTKFKDKLQRRFLQSEARKEEIEQDEAGDLLYLIRSRMQ